MKKPLLYMAIGTLTLGGLLVGATSVAAQGMWNNQQTLVQKIATKFNLKESDVQAVFNEDHQQRHEQMQQLMADRLTQAVNEGKLTEEQKQLILTKHEEMKDEMQTDIDRIQTMTPQERRTFMQERGTALETWATEHGIDLSYVSGGRGGMMGKGYVMRGGMMGESRQAN